MAAGLTYPGLLDRLIELALEDSPRPATSHQPPA
jgi:hypothetical protein